jgi:hypothetical protein
MTCEVLARIGTALLNKLTEKTGLAHNVGYSGDGGVSRITFAIYYF